MRQFYESVECPIHPLIRGLPRTFERTLHPMAQRPGAEVEPSIVHRIERPTMGSKLVQRSIIHGRHHLRSLILRQSERPGLLRAWQHLISEDGEFDRQGLRFLRLADGEFRGMADRLIHEEELNMQVLLVLLLQAKGEIFYLIIQIDPTSLHLAILVIDDHQEVGILQG